MNIDLQEITVKELVKDYQDNEENGVVGFDGMLDIRPPYQREFIYKDKQRDAVIDTLTKGFPLNVMYWAVRDGGGYELIDGQQRTISICQYVAGDFSFKNRYFDNLHADEKEQILNYKIMVYLCSGTDSEKLEWFKTINIAGEKLYEQELRNAVYSGLWVSDAKRYFSKNNCAAHGLGGDYLTGTPIRQEYLETTIKWISDNKIEQYMAEHQHEPTANELWLYFQSVINWVKVVFPTYRKEMKGIQWGTLYNQFKDGKYDTKKLEKQISELMQDEDVTNKKGIYEYLLTGNEKHLNIRAFSDNQKREAYERQKGICVKCGNHFELSGMEADHIKPWHEGGKTSADNCQMLCIDDNRRKSGK
ncbi:MAG: DUF262 domain-containing protein [Bacteroidetes bacterium]|nr:DUF262 domain-containing protein [Bacteroidota bacterium]